MRTLSLMPWKIHAVLAVVWPVVMVAPAYVSVGFGSTEWPGGQAMSLVFLVVAWVLAVGMVQLEVTAVAEQRLPDARWIACAAHAWLALVGTAPVWFHHAFIPNEPVGLRAVQMATNTYAVLLVGYALLLLAGVVLKEWKRSRQPSRPLGPLR